jgi:hypothetical protein
MKPVDSPIMFPQRFFRCGSWQVVLNPHQKVSSSMLCSTALFLSTLAAAAKPFTFLAGTVTILADMKPRSACILTAFASRRAFSSTVPIPADLCGARSGLVSILGHTLIGAVTINAKSKSFTALETTAVTIHSRSFPHDDTSSSVTSQE